MKHPLFHILLPVGIMILACGPMALPGPTSKSVSTMDLVGIWRYYADFDATEIDLELRSDGTFTQTIRRGAGAPLQIHTGSWGLDGPHPKLTVLKPVFGDPSKPWILEEVNWWVVDSRQKGANFAIFGAADDRDSDSCWEMEKIR